MKSCDIHIKMVDPGELGDVGLSCDIKLVDAELWDKLMLMHTLASCLHLDVPDIILFAKTEVDRVFDENSTKITIPGGLDRES